MDFHQAYNLASSSCAENRKIVLMQCMIMADDEQLRNARLGLLQECVKTLGCLGDLTQLA
jgi:glycyl-tRNA synthetase beta chain